MLTRFRPAVMSLLALGLTACASTGGSSHASSAGSTASTSRSSANGTPSSGPTTGRSAATGSSTSGSAGSGEKITGKPVTLTISSSGDVLPHPGILKRAQANAGGSGFDFAPMFADVKPILTRSDLSICQLETPISADDTNLAWTYATSFPRHNSPHELLDAVKDAGFDGCSTANNHAFDNGMTGLVQTSEQMKTRGLQPSGPGPSTDQTPLVAVYDVKGVKVAQLSYSFTLTNNPTDQTAVPEQAPWLGKNLYSVVNVDGIIKDAKAARSAGADFVIVSMHWGLEQTRQLSKDQLNFGPALMKSGAIDFIIGNHPHVVQQCAKFDGRYVVYSEGNMLSLQGPGAGQQLMAQDGEITTLHLTRDAAGNISEKLTFQPTWVDRGNGAVIKLASPTSNAASYERTVSAMKGDGSCDATPAD